MAVVFVDGFDIYNGNSNTLTAPGLSTRWTFDVSGNAPATTTGRFGGQGVSYYGFNAAVYAMAAYLPGTYSSGCIGYAIYLTGIPANTYVPLSVGKNHPTSPSGVLTYTQVNLRLNGDGSISVYRGNTVIGTSAVGLTVQNAWMYIELEYVISSTVGVAKVYLNNNPTPILSLTGVNTQNLATNEVNSILIGAAGNVRITTLDDLYVTDSPNRLGEQRVITSYPSSDVLTTYWSSSTSGAAPYTMIDEAVCDGDTTYVSSNTYNSRLVVGVPSLPVAAVDVNAVQLTGFARKDETQFRQLALEYQNTAGSVATGPTYTLGASYVYVNDLMPQNPLTGTAWTGTDVNNMRIGARVVT